MRLSILAAGLTLAMAATSNAATLPEGGQLNFDVIRKGKDIGDHSYAFNGTGGSFSVRVSTDVAVKIPIIRTNAYRFQHSSVETWEGGKLRTLKAATNDDGTPHELSTAGDGLIPASLWNDDTVRAGKLLNTIDGHVMSVKVADLGNEQVATGSGKITAHHYRLTGDLARDLWYDDVGNLAHVVCTADDGSIVSYVRR
jgi:hypothetical protein